MAGIGQHLGEALLGRHPWDDVFIGKVSERVKRRCALVPVHVHHRARAEMRLVEAAREAIVEVFLEEFPNAIFPLRVRRDWPQADCIICEDEAVIRFSFSPETDELMGGAFVEPVRILVRRPPPNAFQRATRSLFGEKTSTATKPKQPVGQGQPTTKTRK